MHEDAQGLLMTTASAEAAAGYDHVVAGYLKYRFDTPLRLKAALKADPEAPMLNLLKGSFAMLAYKATYVEGAKATLEAMQPALARATERERAHAAALAAWADDEMDRALAIWEGILNQHPRDILAFRMHHFCAFWLGRPEAMLKTVESILPRWDASVPGWGSVLACRSFANEEAGNYTIAEAAGRAAIEDDPADLWATHAIAHVLEMQGRRGEGIAWIQSLKEHFAGANNLAHHVWWHQAMYHLERREFGEVLRLYDFGFRDLDSAVTQQQPDLYIDMQNAISMLFRLQRHGVDVGDRWIELADKAEGRIGDCRSAFTLPHWMMALCAEGRFDAARSMLEGMRDVAGANRGTTAPIVARYAIPVSEAVLLHAQGDHRGAVAAMRPALQGMYALGGSHAQQDVLEQLFLEAAMKGGMAEDARMLLERVAGRHPVPPERRIGYAAAAAAVAY
ncbi:MAG: tetratricopeptide repeat protein [Acetobacteraceae bacterium]|nr:tetratricopeptide repeat protein [Acetobacteraceae bacterium]